MSRPLKVIESLTLWRYWTYKAVLSFKLRYRGTSLGLVWPVLSTLFVVLVIGTVWGVLLKKDNLVDYYLYLLSGYSIWTVISISVEQGCREVDARNVGGTPFFTIILERSALSLIQFSLVLPLVFMLVIYSDKANLSLFLFVPLVLTLLILWSIGLISIIIFLVSLVPDFKHLINAMMRLSFLATPIIWDVDQLGVYKDYIWFNPFYLPLEASRQVLIGSVDISLMSYFCLYALLLISIGCVLVKAKMSEIVK